LCEAIGWRTHCDRQWLTRIMAGRYGLIQQVEALRDRAMWGAGQHRAHGRPPNSGCSLKVPAWSAPSSSILGEKAETRGFPPLRVGCQSGTAQGAFTYSYITAHVLVYIPTRAEQWPPPRKPPLPDTNSIHRRRRLQCLPRSVGREAAQALTMELIPRTKGHPLTPESDVPCRGGLVCVVWGLPSLTRTPAFGNGQDAHRGVPALQLASSATPNERLTSCRQCSSPSQGS
jgi:hypothetical protein